MGIIKCLIRLFSYTGDISHNNNSNNNSSKNTICNCNREKFLGIQENHNSLRLYLGKNPEGGFIVVAGPWAHGIMKSYLIGNLCCRGVGFHQ